MLEGMISKEIIQIRKQFVAIKGSNISLEKWASGLITRLLVITHGQWIYCNFVLHDPVSGTIATAKKEELLLEIEHQRALGDSGLLDEDKYLAEVNLDEMLATSGEHQHYWLLAIKTACKAKLLQEQKGDRPAGSSRTTTADRANT